jgi:hypothetical protein
MDPVVGIDPACFLERGNEVISLAWPFRRRTQFARGESRYVPIGGIVKSPPPQKVQMTNGLRFVDLQESRQAKQFGVPR